VNAPVARGPARRRSPRRWRDPRGDRRPWGDRRARRDRGAVTLEVAILAPVLLAMVSLAIFAMRLQVADEAVAFAAHDAARIASLSRTEGEAVSRGTDTARATLQREDLPCLGTPDVHVQAGQFNKPVGETAVVSATVTCTLRLSDLGLPGVPGTKVVTATFTSYLDQYRGRS
jgi:Flp pilus assembly protein TadG